MINKKLKTLITLIQMLTACSYTVLVSAAVDSDALDQITNKAASLCAKVDTEQSIKITQAKASGKVDFPAVSKFLIDVGVDADINYSDEKRKGVLQDELYEALKDRNECVFKMTKFLTENFYKTETSNSSLITLQGKPGSLTKDEFTIAGMKVSCNIPVSYDSTLQSTKQAIPDSTPPSRMIGHAAVSMALRGMVLSKGKTNIEYECTFDDIENYIQFVLLKSKIEGATRHCSSFRQTSSSGVSEGKRVTETKVACLNNYSTWEIKK